MTTNEWEKSLTNNPDVSDSKIDYRKYRKSKKKSLTTLGYDLDISDWSEISLGKIVKNILKDFFNMTDYRATILASYALMPTPLIDSCPILFLFGETGSGKSKVLTFLARLHGREVENTTASAKGLRNILNEKNMGGGDERNIILCYDNLMPGTFTKEFDLFQYFLVGAYRETSKSRIADAQTPGTVITFDVFGKKAFSSAWDILSVPRLIELRRRALVIQTVKSEIVLPDIAAFHLSEIATFFKELWRKKHLIEQWLEIREVIIDTPNNYVPCHPNRWAFFIELATTAVFFGYGCPEDIFDEIKFFENSNKALVTKNPVAELIETYCLNMNCIESNYLKQMLVNASENGQIDFVVNNKSIAEIMTDLGYQLVNVSEVKSIVRMAWQRIGKK